MTIIAALIMLAVTLGFLWLLFKLLKRPLMWLIKFLLHALLGYIFLFMFNFIGAWFGLGLTLNWFNAAVVGVCGVPGVIILLILEYLIL